MTVGTDIKIVVRYCTLRLAVHRVSHAWKRDLLPDHAPLDQRCRFSKLYCRC